MYWSYALVSGLQPRNLANSFAKLREPNAVFWDQLSPEEGLSREAHSSNRYGGDHGGRDRCGPEFCVNAVRYFSAVANFGTNEQIQCASFRQRIGNHIYICFRQRRK